MIIRIGIADDHVLLREGLKALLLEYEQITVLFDVGNGIELLNAIKKKQPEIILLDLEMPGMNGMQVLEVIKIKYPLLKVIVLTNYYSDSHLIEFISKGASAFLPKNYDIEKIMDAIYTVHEKGFYYDKHTDEILKSRLNLLFQNKQASNNTCLTNRELSIIRMVCSGMSNKDIANQLNLSVRTIEGNRYSISKKTNTHNALALLDYATKNKILIQNQFKNFQKLIFGIVNMIILKLFISSFFN